MEEQIHFPRLINKKTVKFQTYWQSVKKLTTSYKAKYFISLVMSMLQRNIPSIIKILGGIMGGKLYFFY